MDRKVQAIDNVYIEKFWRNIKYNYFYVHVFETGSALYEEIGACI